MHRIGEIIDDRYQLTRPLGLRHGAEMWEAEHQVANRRVTLKIIPSENLDATMRKRLVGEARATAEIAHPTVVEVYDVGSTRDGGAYLVTELLRGETLADILVREGAMQAEDACHVTLQILQGLDAAHGVSIAHGQLRSDNVILRRARGGHLVVKVLDFGLAQLDALAVGRTLDPRADVQALAGMLFEMLSGRSSAQKGAARAAPGGAAMMPEAARSLVPAIPAALARIVDEALVAGPGAISSAREMAEMLTPFAIAGRPPSIAPRDTLMPFLSPEARRSRGMARLERAVLGLSDPKPKNSARPNLVLIDSAQERERPAVAEPSPPGRALEAQDLLEPRIPKAPRTPRHLGAAVRTGATTASDRNPRSRRRSSRPLRRWKAIQRRASRGAAPRASLAIGPLSQRLWPAVVAVAGVAVGLLLSHLLHL